MHTKAYIQWLAKAVLSSRTYTKISEITLVQKKDSVVGGAVSFTGMYPLCVAWIKSIFLSRIK